MSNGIRKVLIAVLLVVFLGSGGMLLWKQLDYHNGAENYQEASQLAQVTLPEDQPKAEPEPQSGDPYIQGLETLDLAALRAVNPDVVGWMLVPGTSISYPLLQGADNDYYLNHTWDGTRNSVGAVFMDYRNDPALGDFNTILYGHKMNNDAMFGLLHQYKNEGYLEAHPYLYLANDRGIHRYDIFAYYETATTNTYTRDFPDEAAREAYLAECLAQRWVDPGITPGVEDHILTLSTCTGNGHATRWVVQAVREK
ncbi:MAG: class B sortase [Ruminiclostridium sp.]|nr:class B sortase [Ruminiclostridium sp.]